MWGWFYPMTASKLQIFVILFFFLAPFCLLLSCDCFEPITAQDFPAKTCFPAKMGFWWENPGIWLAQSSHVTITNSLREISFLTCIWNEGDITFISLKLNGRNTRRCFYHRIKRVYLHAAVSVSQILHILDQQSQFFPQVYIFFLFYSVVSFSAFGETLLGKPF